MTSPAHTIHTVSLSAELQWADEFAWSRREASASRGLTGALIVQSATRTTQGRPITLASVSQNQGWVTRETLLALYALAQDADATYLLNLADGRTFNVMFRPGEEIQAEPLAHLCYLPGSMIYTVRIPLMTI